MSEQTCVLTHRSQRELSKTFPDPIGGGLVLASRLSKPAGMTERGPAVVPAGPALETVLLKTIEETVNGRPLLLAGILLDQVLGLIAQFLEFFAGLLRGLASLVLQVLEFRAGLLLDVLELVSCLILEILEFFAGLIDGLSGRGTEPP